MSRVWSDFWFRPDAPTNLAVARVLLAGSSLWVALSRPDLPSILEYPRAMWQTVPPERRIRFLLLFDMRTERILWYALHVALILAMIGVATRWMSLASALLLYHFAPLEAIFRNGNPNLFGFTTPCVALVIVAASASGGRFMRASERWQHRWPLALIEFLLAAMYFFAGYSKLFATGLEWLAPRNIRNTLLAINQALELDTGHSLASWIADHPLLCGATSICGVVFELTFPLVLFSKVARRVYVPLAFVFHILNAVVFRIYFQSIWLLLIFIDWHGLIAKRIMRE